MSFFFSQENLKPGGRATIADQEARHALQSRRVKAGERIKAQGPDGRRFLVEVVEVSKTILTVQALEELPVPAKPARNVALMQAMVAEQALDHILQKATELGVEKICLFPAANSPHLHSGERLAKKLPRWEKIILEAAKQCERAEIPPVIYIQSFDEALNLAPASDKTILLDMGGNVPSTLLPPPSSLALFVGPEGGFTTEEISKIKSLPNTATLALGPNILRAETAVIAGLAVVLNV